MFTPVHLLPQYNISKREKYTDRWDDTSGQALRDKILTMIRAGAGEDFLQWDFEQGQMGFLEDMWDLKGLNIFQEDITFPHGDNFEAINFSYADFYHSKFKNALFNCNFSFSKIYNCEFTNCVFSFNSFYGATLEKVKFTNCDFFECNTFTNCDYIQVGFENCFIPENLFIDCRFDENTKISNPIQKPLQMTKSGLLFDNKQLSGIFKGIKEAYASGNVVNKSRDYFFKQMQSVTRYNSSGVLDKLSGYFLEYIAGYGVKPFRVLSTMLGIFLFSLYLFSQKIGLSDGLILTSGALFTFGANADLLKALDVFYKVLYVATSFFGISLTALFITVLANVWLREK